MTMASDRTRRSISQAASDVPDTSTIATPRRRPGRPTTQPPGEIADTRERILTHARRLFMRRGYAGVSVGELATAVGVTKPTLYYYFGDKEGLYAEVLCDILREVGQYLRNVTETRLPVRERLFELALGFFMYADATMEPMLRDTGELLGPERAAVVWQIYDQDFNVPLRDLMLEGMRQNELRTGDPGTLVRAFLGLLGGFTPRGGHLTRSEAEHREVAETLVSLFLGGAGLPSQEQAANVRSDET